MKKNKTSHSLRANTALIICAWAVVLVVLVYMPAQEIKCISHSQTRLKAGDQEQIP